MVAGKDYSDEMNEVMIELRQEGKVQLFNDGSDDPLIIKLEQTN